MNRPFPFRSPHPALALALVLGAALPLAACGPGEPASASAPRPTAVRSVPVRQGPIRHTLRYVGTIASQREVRVLARVPGTLRALPVAEGERAARGDALARLDVPEDGPRLSRLNAELRRVGAEASRACGQYERERSLASTGDISQARLDAGREACSAARAAVSASRAALAEGRSASVKSVEVAGFDGLVLEHLVEPGQHVQPGHPLLRFGSEALEVRVMVAEEDVRQGIQVGTPVRLGAQGERAARVTEVAAAASGPARSVAVDIALDERFPDLRHGMSVDVQFVLDERPDATAVPRRALQRRGESHEVFVVRGDRVERLAVVPGLVSGGWVAIEPALPPGTAVAVGDLRGLHDGAPVYPVAVEEDAP